MSFLINNFTLEESFADLQNQHENLKENIPKLEDVQLKFYDGYALEDSWRRLQDSINFRFKLQNELLNPPTSVPISLDLSEGNQEKKIYIYN